VPTDLPVEWRKLVFIKRNIKEKHILKLKGGAGKDF